MAHVITETATFTASVTVPDGVDSREDAAEVATALAQALANRTKYLKAVTDVAAKVTTANAFVGAQTVTGTVTASGNVRGLGLVADSNCTVGNDLIVTHSASVGDYLTVTRSLYVHDDLVVDNNVTISDNLTVEDNATIGSDGTGTLTVGTSVTTPSYLITTGGTRTTYVDLSKASGHYIVDALGSISPDPYRPVSSSWDYTIRIPIDPIAGHVGTVTAYTTAFASAPDTWNLMRRTFALTSTPAITAIAKQTTSGSGFKTIVLTPAALDINASDGATYYLEWVTSNGAMVGGCKLYGIGRSWNNDRIINSGV